MLVISSSVTRTSPGQRQQLPQAAASAGEVLGREAEQLLFRELAQPLEIGTTIEIAGLGVTRMFCQDRMETEQSFLDALSRVRSYRLDGAMLVLLDAAGTAVMKLAD